MAYKDPEKRKEYRKEYREANREREVAKSKAWYEANRERKAATDKAWREANREREVAKKKAWRKANREREAATNKAWREANRERKAATRKAWREANRERAAAYDKAWRKANRERKAVIDNAWRKANRERVAATRKTWREANPELVSEQLRRRRAQKKNATVPLTASEKEAMRVLGRTRLNLQEQTDNIHDIDHIVPLDYGGIHHPSNLRVLDRSTNSSKQNKITPEALALVGENYRLYRERVGLEKAEWFRSEIAQAIGLEMANRLIDSPVGSVIPTTPTLEDLLT